jgi:hypothetical protein
MASAAQMVTASLATFGQPAFERLRVQSMRDVGRHHWEFRFALHHSFGQPLKPLRPSVAGVLLTQVLDVRSQFFPGKNNRAAKKIVHHVERQFVVKNQHADAFPCAGQVRDHVFAIWTEDFLDLFPARVVGQFDDPPERLRKSGTLKRAHQAQHRFPPALPPIIANLSSRENHARGDRDGVDQVGEG